MKIKWCPDCDTPMDRISEYKDGGEFWICPICNPDPFGREEDRMIDYLDMKAEMKFDDDIYDQYYTEDDR